MELKMNNHLEEILGSFIATAAYVVAHFTGMKFTMLDSQVVAQTFNLTDRLTTCLFGVLTAIVAYFAIYFIKKYITHESK